MCCFYKLFIYKSERLLCVTGQIKLKYQSETGENSFCKVVYIICQCSGWESFQSIRQKPTVNEGILSFPRHK